MKGLILSGGKGTRLRPITHTSAKQLVPVANKPVLFYGIEAMAEAGIEEVGIIIAPETGDEIREAAGDGSQFGVRDHLHRAGRAARARPRGPHRRAVPRRRPVRDVPRRQPAAGRHHRPRAGLRASAPDALILLTPVPDPENYGVAELDGDRVVRLVEKPAEPATDLALVGVYMFTAGIHDAARAIEPSARGELEITDAIQHLVDGGRRVEPHIVRGWWKDTGPPGGHARGQPARPRPRRAERGGRADRLAVSTGASSSSPGPGWSARRSAGRRSSARARGSPTPTSARTPRSARTA